MTDYLITYGYGFLLLVVLLESTGLPLPGESLVMAAGMLAGEGSMNLPAVLGAAFLGSIVGDNLGYLVGRRYGRAIVVRWGEKVGLGEKRFAMVEERFQSYGFMVVLIARFVIILRQLNGFVAGTMHMSWPKFVLYNAISAAAWSGAYGFGAYLFGTAFKHLLGDLGTWPILVIAALVCLVGCIGTYKFLFPKESDEEEASEAAGGGR